VANHTIEEALQRARAKDHLSREAFPGHRYRRLTDDTRGWTRGTAVFDDGTVIAGYPHIGRLLRLEGGLSEHFAGPFWAEEKIDGFNVRIFRHHGEVLALTRGGFPCYFTMDRWSDFMDGAVLEADPDLVICAELAGPDNPYLVGAPPFIEEDVQLFVFDLMRKGAPSFVPVEVAHDLIARFALPGVQVLGRYGPEDLAAIQQMMRELNGRGSEGAVFKAEGPDAHRSKYITSASSMADIRDTARHMPDLPAEYFTGRLIRLAAFVDEEGITGQSAAALREELGAAMLDGLLEALEQYRRHHRVFHSYRCRLHSRTAAERLFAQIGEHSGHIQVRQRRLEREGPDWILEFDKSFPRITGLLGNILAGGMVFD
jgi:putative ATP-dependent DNA ligase